MAELSEYLRKILTSRVYDIVKETPLDDAPSLSKRLGSQVLIKREDAHPVFSFKLRGSYNKMANLAPDELARGVIASSAGNHAQGVATSANKLGTTAVIVMPETSPEVKIDAVRALGAEVVLHGESYSDAYDKATELMAERGLTFVHAFDDPDVIAGQGTVGMEILRQHTGEIEAIFVPVGGGGLISGIGAYIKELRPDIRIIGVQTEDSDAMAQSVAAGGLVQLDQVGLFSDGTAIRVVGNETLAVASQVVDEFIRVDTDAVCAAIKDVFTDTRAIMEPSGALGVAGMKEYVDRTGVSGTTLIAVTTGANMNFDRLRFVSERSEIGEEREAIFAVTLPEEPGSFRRFIETIGTERNVTEFNYRISDDAEALVFVGVSVTDRDQAAQIAASFEQAGLTTIDLTDDELSKVHIRHMVGGRSPLALDERLFRFEFPERPGALTRFLTSMSPTWNISLFHYRNHGADVGRVLVGLQVPTDDDAAFAEFLTELGYPHEEQTAHPAYQMFLR